METSVIVTMVFSIASTLLVIWEIIVNTSNNDKNRNVRTVTEERSKWINNIRNEFCEIIELFNLAISKFIEHKNNNSSVDLTKDILSLRQKYIKIKFMLNFENRIDKDILNKILQLICVLDCSMCYSNIIGFPDYDVEELFASKDLISIYMNMYLKAEWERLKHESKVGKIDSKFFDEKFNSLAEKNKDEISKYAKNCFDTSIKEFITKINNMLKERKMDFTFYNIMYTSDL